MFTDISKVPPSFDNSVIIYQLTQSSIPINHEFLTMRLLKLQNLKLYKQFRNIQSNFRSSSIQQVLSNHGILRVPVCVNNSYNLLQLPLCFVCIACQRSRLFHYNLLLNDDVTVGYCHMCSSYCMAGHLQISSLYGHVD